MKIKGTPNHARVLEIVSDFELVKWDGLKPKFILITMEDTGNLFMAHASQLKLKGKAK